MERIGMSDFPNEWLPKNVLNAASTRLCRLHLLLEVGELQIVEAAIGPQLRH
jgi:hypothetical protein